MTFSHCFANSFASFALYCMCVSLCFFFSSTSSLPQILGLRSSLELRLTNHQALAIIFQLEYVFSTPIGRETMVREKQKHMDFVNQHSSQKWTQDQSETLKQVLTTLSQLHSVRFCVLWVSHLFPIVSQRKSLKAMWPVWKKYGWSDYSVSWCKFPKTCRLVGCIIKIWPDSTIHQIVVFH